MTKQYRISSTMFVSLLIVQRKKKFFCATTWIECFLWLTDWQSIKPFYATRRDRQKNQPFLKQKIFTPLFINFCQNFFAEVLINFFKKKIMNFAFVQLKLQKDKIYKPWNIGLKYLPWLSTFFLKYWFQLPNFLTKGNLKWRHSVFWPWTHQSARIPGWWHLLTSL